MSQIEDYDREFENMYMFSSITPQGTKRARPNSPGCPDESIVDKMSILLDSKLGKIDEKLSKLDEIQTSLRDMSDTVNAVEDSQRAVVDKRCPGEYSTEPPGGECVTQGQD